MFELFLSFFGHKKSRKETTQKKDNLQNQEALICEKQVSAHRPIYEVQLAVYDSPYNPPRVLYLNGDDCMEVLHNLANETYNFAQAKGGKIPYVALKEVLENLIHANLQDVVVTILDNGNTIRVSDRGPGIKDKEKIFLPGFSTATNEMKKYIKGVGSGLTICKEALAYFGGSVTVEDNLGQGTVFTLSVPEQQEPSRKIENIRAEKTAAASHENTSVKARKEEHLHKKFNEILTDRQKKVLLLIAEMDETGPSCIAKELDMSLSTAYRELVALENQGLVVSTSNGKRKLTEKGLEYMSFIFA